MRTAVQSAWLRAAILALLVAVGAVLALTTELPSVATVRAWLDGAGAAGWAALVLGVAVVLLAPVPRSAVSVLLGVVVGFGPGLAVALSGGLLGGLAAFGLSRVLGRPAAAWVGGHRLAAVDRLMTDRGFTAVLVGRLLPVVPFVVLSYGAGLTAIRLGHYALATAVGLLPSTVVQVGAGASAETIVAWSSPVVVLLTVAVLALVGLGVLLRRLRARASAADQPAPVPPIPG
ncbi:MAG: Conserved rane protein of unknown function [Blastococcus sp.]|nr:Conserved rane protein of unknown function [Blastococcus sp.]